MSQTKAQLISDLVQALNFTGTSSAPANGMYLSAANTIKLATNSNGRLTIDSDGNTKFTGNIFTTVLRRDVQDSSVILSGGNATNDGANIALYGSTHGSQAGNFEFRSGASYVLKIKSDGKVGIGTTSPTGSLTIASGTFQSTTPTSTGDDIVISGDVSLGLQFLTLDANTCNNNIYFGDTADPDVGMIRYAHASNSMLFQTNTSTALTLGSGQDATFTASVYIPDNEIIGFGDPALPDLRIYHENSGSNGMIFNKTGDLYIQGNDGSGNAQTAIQIHDTGAVDLKYAGLGPYLSTTATGVTITSPSHDGGLLLRPANNNQETRLDIQGKASDGTLHAWSIGASRSADRFYVSNTANTYFSILDSGFIGMGTANARRHLHIHNPASPAATVGMMLTNSNTGEENDSQGFQFKVGSDSHAEIAQLEDSYIQILTDGDNAMRITNDQKVGIGTTSPSSKLHVASGSSGATANTSSVVTIESSDASYNILQFLSPNTAHQQVRFGDPQDNGHGFIDYDHGNAKMLFGANGPTKLTIEAGGDLNIEDGNLVVADGHGIDFSATAGPTGTGAGSTSELFDDYEVGTWTPLLMVDSGTNITVDTNSSSGHYTKIGNVVTITCYHRTDGITKGSASDSSNINIGNLPYTPSSNTQRNLSNIGFNVNWAEYPNTALIQESSTMIKLYKYPNSGGNNTGTRLTVAAVATGSNANYALLTMVYRT